MFSYNTLPIKTITNKLEIYCIFQEALTTLLNQNSSMQATSNVTASLNDEYAQVFGPKCPGRVRCVGRGPTPSKFLGRSTAISSGTENFEIAQLKMQSKALEDQVTNMSSLFHKMFSVASVDQVILSLPCYILY